MNTENRCNTYLEKNRIHKLGMYDVGGKPMSGIKSMHINSLACVRLKGSESECFRIESGVRQGCIISPWLFNMYMDAVMKEVKVGIGRWE